METREEEHFVYDGFLISVVLKGIISVVEVFSGIAAFFVPSALIIAVAGFLLSYIPFHWLASTLGSEVAHYTDGTVTYVAFYLLTRGVIKTFLIFALLKNWLWAYPLSLFVLTLFLVYQGFQILNSHSLIVSAISVFDLIVMYFIWREWRIVVAHHGARPA